MKVELLAAYGSDLDVVNAARVSFNKESGYDVKTVPADYTDAGDVSAYRQIKTLKDGDRKLLSYLADHNHWSPFSHVFASFRIKAPIYVARQLGKHQVGLAWNEVSRRYVDGGVELDHCGSWRMRAKNVKQGSGVDVVPKNSDAIAIAESATQHAYTAYNELLELGVCPEQARMVLPQNTMTEWIWSGSLYAFARVCNLRIDVHSQQETRDVAEQISACMSRAFPESWKCLTTTK